MTRHRNHALYGLILTGLIYGLAGCVPLATDVRKEAFRTFDKSFDSLGESPPLNEVIDLAGLMHKTKNFSSRELEKCKEIIGNAERKIQEMDRYLGKEELQSPPSTIADVEFAGMAAS